MVAPAVSSLLLQNYGQPLAILEPILPDTTVPKFGLANRSYAGVYTTDCCTTTLHDKLKKNCLYKRTFTGQH